MLRKRQSSVIVAVPKVENGCGQSLPNCVASCVVTGGTSGWGGLHRKDGGSGWAYRTPRNSRIVLVESNFPWKVPSGALTSVGEARAGSSQIPKLSNNAALRALRRRRLPPPAC